MNNTNPEITIDQSINERSLDDVIKRIHSEISLPEAPVPITADEDCPGLLSYVFRYTGTALISFILTSLVALGLLALNLSVVIAGILAFGSVALLPTIPNLVNGLPTGRGHTGDHVPPFQFMVHLK